jgi:hypothetical protein
VGHCKLGASLPSKIKFTQLHSKNANSNEKNTPYPQNSALPVFTQHYRLHATRTPPISFFLGEDDRLMAVIPMKKMSLLFQIISFILHV